MSVSKESAESALSAEAARVAPELYFLVAKFLSQGPLKKTAEVLTRELEEKKVLPTRLDWEGYTHEQTFEELERRYDSVPRSHLLEVCVELLRRPQRVPRVSLLSRALAGRDVRPDRGFAPHHIVTRLLRRAEGRPPWHSAGAGGTGAALLSPQLFSSLELQRRTLGHLSAVYCLQYDRTGNYVITGADDLLVKVWSAVDGRLLTTLRGAASEITDVCVSSDNRLLCAGSLDRHIRVWELQTGAPVAVLQGHSGMITSVHFCPARAGDLRCLVSTSTDGSVAFWTYSQAGLHSRPSFISKPVQYMERMRPGACHMICCSWSPGGAFLAAGSADHHVRVYMMSHDGPKRILEVAAHGDAVDSLAWCHRGLRFVSGSKDGTAILWQLHAMQWRHTTLHMTTCLPGEKMEQEEGKRLKVTMVCWDCADRYIITAASDHTIKVWCARTCRLVRVLRGHTDETYVLEAHPFLSLLLSASHDGQVIVWNLESGDSLYRFLNHLEGQGHGAVYDAKWRPDGSGLAATDSHGHLLLWGFGQGHANLKKLPTELFFHTDYRPLVRDALGGALDEQTEVPPHLMPPPFLVDVEGAPHPPHLQRLVPGRENLDLERLVPLTGEGGQDGPRSHIDRMIALVLRDMDEREGNLHAGHGAEGGGAGAGGAAGSVWRGEGVRHTAGVWQRGEPLEYGERRPCVAPPQRAVDEALEAASEEMSQLEMAWYRREMRRRPLMISTAEAGAPSGPRRRAGRARGGGARQRPRPAPARAPRPADARPTRERAFREDEELSEQATAEDTSDTSDTSVRMSVERSASSEDKTPASSSSSSSDYSDWVADKPNISLAPPKRSKRRPIVRKRYSPAPAPSKRAPPDLPPCPSTSAQHEQLNGDINGEMEEEPRVATPPAPPTPPIPVELPEQYRPSEWLCAVSPRKAPYHPQMGDECYYLKQGHQSYLDAVAVKDVYKINARDKPWERTHINDCELVKVVGVKYLLRPPRLVCLKLAAIRDPHRTFTIKYHDMPDVIDFLVLAQQYRACEARAWAAGDRFRCMIDDMWWTGSIVECLREQSADGADDAEAAARHFLSLRVRWDNGEYERMSPWDLEPIDPERLPAETGGCTPVLARELEAVLYRPRADEWPPDGDRERACRHIVRALDQVMMLSVAEPFVVPVDLNMYPAYAYVVEYPIDLSTIKARFENHFYRRVAAAQFDVRYLATNAEKFNRPHSDIVRQARIVTDLLLHIISNWEDVDVMSVYHSINDGYRSSDSDAVPEPTTSRGRKSKSSRLARAARTSWTSECARLLSELMRSPDAAPFLHPVSEAQAPDYRSVVACPMDLGTVAARLQLGGYARREHLARDVRLVFGNSRLYNTNERSRIFAMTQRLSALFETLYRRAVRSLRTPRAPRGTRHHHQVEADYGTSDEETLAATSRRRRTRRGARGDASPVSSASSPASSISRASPVRGDERSGRSAALASSGRADSWDSDVPLTRQGKGKGVGKKSKPSSTSVTADDASTSRDAGAACAGPAPLLRLPRIDALTGYANGCEDGTSASEYEELQVLEEEVAEDEVEVTYSDGTRRSARCTSRRSDGTPQPRHKKRHKARRKRNRVRRSSDSDYSDASVRRGHRPGKRRKRGPVERAESPPSTSSESAAPRGEPQPARYESDRSYRPRLSSDDSAPLHTYRRSGSGGARHGGRERVEEGGGRRRRGGPEPSYNEDSEEDSIAAISKRLREHTAQRSGRLRGAGAPATVAPRRAVAARDTDHNYFNGGAIAYRQPPSTSHYNGNTSDGGEEEPLSVSSRGRVRKLTAKARGLLRD